MTGSEIQRLITEAKINGISETTWLMLINTELLVGTQAQRWRWLVDACKKQGVTAASETRLINGKPVEFVVVRPD